MVVSLLLSLLFAVLALFGGRLNSLLSTFHGTDSAIQTNLWSQTDLHAHYYILFLIFASSFILFLFAVRLFDSSAIRIFSRTWMRRKNIEHFSETSELILIWKLVIQLNVLVNECVRVVCGLYTYLNIIQIALDLAHTKINISKCHVPLDPVPSSIIEKHLNKNRFGDFSFFMQFVRLPIFQSFH